MNSGYEFFNSHAGFQLLADQHDAVSDGKIDSNRFTLPNRNEQLRFSTTATSNALYYVNLSTVLQDRVMAYAFASVSMLCSCSLTF